MAPHTAIEAGFDNIFDQYATAGRAQQEDLGLVLMAAHAAVGSEFKGQEPIGKETMQFSSKLNVKRVLQTCFLGREWCVV